MLAYTLGTRQASEALIRDLYIDLREKVNAWSEITCQTPQARMGYIGQHLGGGSPQLRVCLLHGGLLHEHPCKFALQSTL